MRLILLIFLISLVSCATQAPTRKIASEGLEKFGNHDPKRSLVQIIPGPEDHKTIAFYLYVQLKDSRGKYIDAKPSEFKLATRKGSQIDYDYERALVGRYYLTILKSEKIASHEIDLFVQGKALKEQFKLHLNRPHKKFSKLNVLKKKRNKLVFELKLYDSKNRPVEVPEMPELIPDGPGWVQEVVHVREGVWQFTVTYPDENHITYYSVRAMGITFQKLYRFQHVEKWTREPAASCSRNIFCD